MNPRTSATIQLASVALLLLFGCIFLVWYHAPVRIETIDRLAYCACGYSKVRFHDGRITMIRYQHDTIKSGEQIGTYQVVGNTIKMEIIFKGKAHREAFIIDNIGLVASEHSVLRYYGLNSKSPKTYIHGATDRLESALSEVWSR